jgi:glycosyltransferase involved in cell wall biosynthesis
MVTGEKKDISIVVPIKNMEGRLTNLVRWLINAVENNLEVVLVFDGCEDQTESELESLGFLESQNLKFLRTSGVGPGEARNAGLRAASRKWVVFWDSDDVGNVSALQEIVSTLMNSETQLCICQYQLAPYGDRTSELELISGPLSLNAEAAFFTPAIWRMIFNREFVKDCSFGRMNMGEDQVFIADVISKEPTIQFIDLSLYIYFQGIPEQLTSRKVDPRVVLASISEIVSKIPGTKDKSQKLIYLLILKMSFVLLKRRYFMKFSKLIISLLFDLESGRRRTSLINLLHAFISIIRINRGGFSH